MSGRNRYTYDQIANSLWTWEGKDDSADNRNTLWLRNFWAELPTELHTMIIRNTLRLANDTTIRGSGIIISFEIACRTLIKELQSYQE